MNIIVILSLTWSTGTLMYNGYSLIIAEEDGEAIWRVELEWRRESQYGPVEITAILGGGEQRIKLENVMFGEVWLCSGQSNMRWPVSRVSEYNYDSICHIKPSGTF